ncbi:serine/threonine-protein kinase [Paenibacillus cellulosilyticus]|uniref:Serine/threonine-protein kinase PrkC n=1 Tax=Paenibacillus cellulosilyticus TaxID=375489 RepID=A0A2V2YWU1_9BACL|nr:Stk1 family PASTA domain-containing Ser/Thr kinase [Paenibacillus cellulosilyticus]PWW06217.1 serine/threonine-protein kinase [Paenibacillus cellulosilyticus]QKS43021.1 Stk1 family PASTA domain-containing Ser/Thr kinase [Paenibacillus cellulosilyticus]
MIGHELGGRYEIISRIGGGGMALVYKAHDVLLNRKVAVKVLRQQFVHDEEFIRRFRREAQSAASLSHPNVVSIYDVGREDDVHFIVMEYVEGSNLNEIIHERAPLQPEEAVHIAAQICDALVSAHQNQIIHRDIKPHNILIGNNGRVKVTDFGIARAVTASTITQTGSVVGSVHYFSPEHAKGTSTGEKSDLYSLGIVLYQMLTGKLPFHGESPISVALKHLQETFVEPRALNSLIPQSVENVILRAMRKNPSERYASAGDMLRDLETCLLPERLHEPKAVFTAIADDLDETRVMPAIRQTASAGRIDDRSVQSSQERTPAGATLHGTQQIEWEEDAKRKPWWKRPVTLIIATLIIIAGLYFAVRSVTNSLDVPEVQVPSVINMTLEEAKLKLEEQGLMIEEPVIYEYSDDVAEGYVYDQSKMNMKVKEGAYIKLYVSKGSELSTMSNYVGQPIANAKEDLAALGIEDTRVTTTQEFSDQEPGTILAQTPEANAQFDPKTETVHFTVSKGQETVEMPQLVGKKEAEAKVLLSQKGLKLSDDNIVREESYEPEGTVIGQFPYQAGEEVGKGAEVSITVSSGLPKDAIERTLNLLISPAQAGTTSEIKITYSDATGENKAWGTRKIKDTQRFSVKVIVAPNKDATVTVMRDNQLVDSFPVTYEDNSAPIDQTIPGQGQTETEQQPSEPTTGTVGTDDATATTNDQQTTDNSSPDGGDEDTHQHD